MRLYFEWFKIAMDNAFDYGSEDSSYDSWQSRFGFFGAITTHLRMEKINIFRVASRFWESGLEPSQRFLQYPLTITYVVGYELLIYTNNIYKRFKF